MFSFHSNLACPAGLLSLRSPDCIRSAHQRRPGRVMNTDLTPRKSKGGRRKGDPAAVRTAVIGVRVSASEYATLCERSAAMHMKPAQWLRASALSRRLPSPPVAAINREQYVELARLAANLNQLTRLANEGRKVTVADALLARLLAETQRLRQALLGVEAADDDR